MKVGQILDDYLDGQHSIGRGVHVGGDIPLAELLELMIPRRAPGNVETAQHDPAANDTWEDWDIITDLNAVLSTGNKIRTGEAVLLHGTLELVNGEAGVNNAKYGHGGMPDDDDTVRTYATQAAAASEFVHGVTLITDGNGNIKVESDDVANLGFVFHLEMYQYVRFTATS